MEIAGFDWDEGNRSKCQKHGVSRAVIESMFSKFNRRAARPSALEVGGTVPGNWQERRRSLDLSRLHSAHTTGQETRATDQRALHAQEGGGALWKRNCHASEAIRKPKSLLRRPT